MKAEIRRVLERKYTYYFFVIILVAILGCTVHLVTHTKGANTLSNYLGYYRNSEELEEQYRVSKDSYEELKLEISYCSNCIIYVCEYKNGNIKILPRTILFCYYI